MKNSQESKQVRIINIPTKETPEWPTLNGRGIWVDEPRKSASSWQAMVGEKELNPHAQEFIPTTTSTLHDDVRDTPPYEVGSSPEERRLIAGLPEENKKMLWQRKISNVQPQVLTAAELRQANDMLQRDMKAADEEIAKILRRGGISPNRDYSTQDSSPSL
jgi:hypothetical protein